MWMLDVDAFMVMYPGLTPGDVMEMDGECFDWLPVVRSARLRAAEMKVAAGESGVRFGRSGPGG